MANAEWFFIIAVALSFFAAWGIGANDVANAMGTSVGSKALTIKQAIFAAAIFEAGGAILAGGQVTHTIGKGIIDFQSANLPDEIMIYGMLASLSATGTWLIVASSYGWPVSTTHCIVGAVLGFGSMIVGVDAVRWGTITSIGLSWIVTPVIAGVIAYFIFMSTQKRILDTDDPLANAKRYGPIYLFFVAFILSLVTFTKGLQNTRFALSFMPGVVVALIVSIGLTSIGAWRIKRLSVTFSEDDKKFAFRQVEKIFAIMMVFTACAMAFAHGSNDVANAIGPLAAVIETLHSAQANLDPGVDAIIPFWVLCLGGLGITLGLAIFGYRVMATIGEGITALTPSRGFAAELSTACTVILASATGLPISTTQTLVGAILGVGLARGIAALNLRVIRGIFLSWVITLPAGALLSLAFFYVYKTLFEW